MTKKITEAHGVGKAKKDRGSTTGGGRLDFLAWGFKIMDGTS
ncbi:hypothetical protein [Seonamhaeicola sp.]|nr:hypothetical protein [Seonamhaeicola sp.]